MTEESRFFLKKEHLLKRQQRPSLLIKSEAQSAYPGQALVVLVLMGLASEAEKELYDQQRALKKKRSKSKAVSHGGPASSYEARLDGRQGKAASSKTRLTSSLRGPPYVLGTAREEEERAKAEEEAKAVEAEAKVDEKKRAHNDVMHKAHSARRARRSCAQHVG